ncbi:hypothetical protein F4779DRAFT_639826 [Xylariaceae sp. FL0662B]|nr:hypothetical protein F4779DRAFT_639826 [Xylariaceae sp. FL0662B]
MSGPTGYAAGGAAAPSTNDPEEEIERYSLNAQLSPVPHRVHTNSNVTCNASPVTFLRFLHQAPHQSLGEYNWEGRDGWEMYIWDIPPVDTEAAQEPEYDQPEYDELEGDEPQQDIDEDSSVEETITSPSLTSFPQFSRLPQEIQDKIWEEALYATERRVINARGKIKDHILGGEVAINAPLPSLFLVSKDCYDFVRKFYKRVPVKPFDTGELCPVSKPGIPYCIDLDLVVIWYTQ